MKLSEKTCSLFGIFLLHNKYQVYTSGVLEKIINFLKLNPVSINAQARLNKAVYLLIAKAKSQDTSVPGLRGDVMHCHDLKKLQVWSNIFRLSYFTLIVLPGKGMAAEVGIVCALD